MIWRSVITPTPPSPSTDVTLVSEVLTQVRAVVNSSPPSAPLVAGRRQVMTAVDPSSRSSAASTSVWDHSRVRSPSIATTKSPCWTPAIWAGESSNTSTA